jgi:hypothetical protein
MDSSAVDHNEILKDCELFLDVNFFDEIEMVLQKAVAFFRTWLGDVELSKATDEA